MPADDSGHLYFAGPCTTSNRNRPSPSGVTISRPAASGASVWVMARPAQRDQAIEVEVRAAARALDQMMSVETATATACVAPRRGAAVHRALDRSRSMREVREKRATPTSA